MADKNAVPNRLINEKSPYLMQHAHNPVNWYPWGEEAFQKAKAEDKPVFLSIGYSTCHWCHVMERESFEDEEVAEALNKDFISIKVDREERPDIDSIYMSVCQALTGHGGWPMTIFMTHDRKPFFAGTYFPKEDKHGRMGFLELILQISRMWRERRADLLSSGDEIMKAVQESQYARKSKDGESISTDTADEAYILLKRSFDRRCGGFGTAPKFPTPHQLLFLLRYWSRYKKDEARYMVEHTLKSMLKGGIYDHIGFGFSRYSTDGKWLVPHFEKMLYDNALLSIAYLEAYQAGGSKVFRRAAEEIFTYVQRDMTSPEGGFYSAEDADSEGVEGKFYLWNPDEAEAVLGESVGREFCDFYDITEGGNFEGLSIPNLIDRSDEDLGETARWENARRKLFEHRERRVHPYKDDKILTSWNGLMIAALARGGRVLKNQDYTRASERAADFILKKLRNKEGRLLARYRDGDAAILAYADDYAFMIWGLLELYEAAYQPCYLEEALSLNDDLLKHFWDDENGGLFLYGDDGEQLIVRPKEIYDGATPSANSQTAINLIRLSRITGDSKYADYAKRIFESFGETVNRYPLGYTHLMSAVLYAESPWEEIVIAGKPEKKDTIDMIDAVHSIYLPFGVSILNPITQSERESVERIIPCIRGRTMIDDKATAYVCRDFACQNPVTDIDKLIDLIRN